MRLTLSELTIHKVFARFDTGSSVAIVVLNRTAETTETLDNANCTEIGVTGIFEWSFDDLHTQPGSLTQFVWAMTDGSTSIDGTIEAGGYPDTIEELIANPSGVVAIETPWIVGNLPSSGTTTIKVYNSVGVLQTLDTDACTEYILGYYRWSTSNMTTYPSSIGSYMWIMTDSVSTRTTWGIVSIGTPEDISDVVWDAARIDHTDAGSFGENVIADVLKISGDSVAADNLELQYDGTGITGDTFPSRQDQLDNLVVTGSAINDVADSFTQTIGAVVSGTYLDTHSLNSTVHRLEDTAGTLDCYYEFSIGADGVPTGVTLFTAVTGLNDSIGVFGYDWTAMAWVQVGTIDGGPSTSPVERPFPLLSSMVGTSTDIGKVRIRLYDNGLTNADVYNDFVYVSYAVVARSVGYADGAIWVKATGTSGTTPFINGTADNPCPYADALVIAAALGLLRFHILSGESVTLTAAFKDSVMLGKNWQLDLGGQDIGNSYFSGARVTGISASSSPITIFELCGIGAITAPPGRYYQCGIGMSSGTFIALQAGQYIMIDCFSLVPGSGSPSFDFTGLGATGVNIRRWSGGSTILMDVDCTVSLEVVTGGGQTITTGGGNLEVRGICRALTVTSSGSSISQFSGVTGEVIVNGTGGTVNLYGVTSALTDNSGALVTINDKSVSNNSVNIEALAAITTYDAATGTDVTNSQTAIQADIAVVDGNVDSILVDTQRVDGLIEDDGFGADRFTEKALEEAPTSSGSIIAQEVWEYVLTGDEGAGSTASSLIELTGSSPTLLAKASDISITKQIDLLPLLKIAGIDGEEHYLKQWRVRDRYGSLVTGIVKRVYFESQRYLKVWIQAGSPLNSPLFLEVLVGRTKNNGFIKKTFEIEVIE